jgi:hypothetical protein
VSQPEIACVRREVSFALLDAFIAGPGAMLDSVLRDLRAQLPEAASVTLELRVLVSGEAP